MITPATAREIARSYGSPAVAIDLDQVERNIARLQAACDAAGLANRPHIKTHKSPVLAKMQLAAGAIGITCQKLGEAEVMAAAGIDNILISYNILGEEKTGRLGALLSGTRVTVAADNPVTIAGLPRAGTIAGRPLPVVIECDTGRRRAGVETPAEAIALARDIASRPELSFAGLLMYPPEGDPAPSQAFLDFVKAGLREHGLEAEIVSGGGTPNLPDRRSQGHDGASLRYPDLQRQDDGAGRRRDAGRMRPQRDRHGGQPGLADTRHPRFRFENADQRSGRRARWVRADPRLPRDTDRSLRRGAWVSGPVGLRRETGGRDRGAYRAEPCLRRRQHGRSPGRHAWR